MVIKEFHSDSPVILLGGLYVICHDTGVLKPHAKAFVSGCSPVTGHINPLSKGSTALEENNVGSQLLSRRREGLYTMSAGNELTEFYDCLAVLYRSLPSETDSEWQEAVKSVLYGGELLADEASCYGAQQKDRNLGKRKEYAQRHGNGTRITEFSAITVAEPRESDRRYVPSGAKLPVAPESGEVLPVKVTSEDVDQAIALLAELPAEPAADTPCTDVDVLLDPERIQRARRHAGTGTGRDETTILFVSDTHLGYENRVKTGSGKTVSWASEISSVKTFKRIARIAVGRDVDAVVHTGDILDHEVDQATLDGAESFLAGLSNFGVSVYWALFRRFEGQLTR